MINVIARVAVKDGSAQEFEAAAAAVRPAFLSDSGCLRFDLQRQIKVEGGYVLLESYDSEEALRRHSQMEEFAAFGAAMADLIEGKPEITLLSPVGEQVDLVS